MQSILTIPSEFWTFASKRKMVTKNSRVSLKLIIQTNSLNCTQQIFYVRNLLRSWTVLLCKFDLSKRKSFDHVTIKCKTRELCFFSSMLRRKTKKPHGKNLALDAGFIDQFFVAFVNINSTTPQQNSNKWLFQNIANPPIIALFLSQNVNQHLVQKVLTLVPIFQAFTDRHRPPQAPRYTLAPKRCVLIHIWRQVC